MMPKINVIVNTGRTIDQGRGKEMGKLSDVYQKDVTQCQIDPEDMKSLGLRRNSNVKVTTQFGSVVTLTFEFRLSPRDFISFLLVMVLGLA